MEDEDAIHWQAMYDLQWDYKTKIGVIQSIKGNKLLFSSTGSKHCVTTALLVILIKLSLQRITKQPLWKITFWAWCIMQDLASTYHSQAHIYLVLFRPISRLLEHNTLKLKNTSQLATFLEGVYIRKIWTFQRTNQSSSFHFGTVSHVIKVISICVKIYKLLWLMIFDL